MRLLIVGNGGRASALAIKLSEDSRVTKMFFAPGNATTQKLGENISETDIVALKEFALKNKVDLTIVGPEATLVDGIVDEFKKVDLKVFGPSKKAASLEGSKAFSKKFMLDNNIKTAKAIVFDSYAEAKDHLQHHNYPVVIKASGLAGGKGVVIAENLEEAESTIHDFMIRRIYGDAGIKVVIEEFLHGFEASIIAFSNGEKLFPCIPVKDYKKAGNGDKGPNTGGMGSAAPSPEFSDENYKDFVQNIMNPTVEGLKKEALNFKGFIFFGLMVTKNGTYLLEYNMRLGDPETQVLLPLLENNLLDLIDDCLNGRELELKFKNKKAVCLVVCSGGYPKNFETGFEITGADKVKNSMLLYAGADYRGDTIVSSGGRVLNLVALGDTFEEARKKVYEDVVPVDFDYAFYRDDIAKF
ncbi:phosphoribosylamine--glycine ligase [Epilithonimonas bovis DSM 19482]|uniref:Phosphoribosylamine--glycine ligase n=1 Tax=Epilithonimonas bovis DSM 19482 TaxID=1121284 RepID=A0A1U7PVK4_9FLAO|nr:phosphoribosylamine--glycine ligase [Epilithonimonas bovis]QIY82793.1 phosphoribosylamine--glycine ligase [Chryseobacterium sp. NEB161]SIT96534.1 phosphoribosylamine--glycine ligase [Epilithonimonas bovis DSM 19482]